MSDRNLTSPDQAAAEIQAPTTVSWADDMALNRCTATHQIATLDGEIPLRCDAAAGHAGSAHQCHHNNRIVHWRD
jgi:hypothetical protein